MTFHHHKKRLLTAGAALVVLAATLTGCSGTPSGADTASKELTVALQAGSATLDPALLDQSLEYYADLAYSPLIIRGSDGTLRPGLATKWGYVGDDNTQFQFTLRDGVVFSDGGALTAQGVVDHLTYVQGAGSAVSALLKGATFTATDAQTVLITFATPVPGAELFFTQFGTGIADVISPAGLADPTSLGTSTHGAGPYILDTTATVSNDHYVYIPNPTYWDAANVHWNKVTIKVIANQSSILNSMKSGQIDVAAFDYTTAADAKAAGINTHSVPNVFSGLNILDRAGTLVPALGDVRVRQAINYAIDRQSIVSAIYGEYAAPTTQTTRDIGYQESLDSTYTYDPDKARQLLADAGYPNGFEMTVASTPVFNGDTMIQAIAGQLSAVGITVKMESIADPTEWSTRMASGEFPASWIGYGSLPLFVEGPSLFLPNAFFNAFHSEDPELTALFGQLVTAPKADVQGISEKISARLVDLAWFAPVGWTPLGNYWSNRVDSTEFEATTGLSPIASLIDVKPAG